MAPTLLITGATGFLGSHLVRLARKRWRVVGTYHRTRREEANRFLAGVDHGRIDLGDFRETKEMLDAVRPAAVIHTAALADPNHCEQHPGESARVNLAATVNLAGLCADRGVPFLFTSTDLVFDGRHPPYREDDPVSPLNVYGEHKALAEEGVLARHGEALICRMPLMFGFSTWGRRTFFAKMVAEMRAGRPVVLFADEYRTPVSGAVAARGLLLMVGSGFEGKVNMGELERVTGRLHLGGRERISRFAMGRLVADVLGLDPELGQPISYQDVPTLAARAPDVSLDSHRAYELGFDPPPLREQVERLVDGGQRAEEGG